MSKNLDVCKNCAEGKDDHHEFIESYFKDSKEPMDVCKVCGEGKDNHHKFVE